MYLVSDYPYNTLPECYKKGNDCGHSEHVNLENTTINTLYLTILEHFKQKEPDISSNVASSFIHYTIYQNPVWDLGLQHKLLCRNFNKDYSTNIKDIEKYTHTCICPCSRIFDWWHKKKGIDKMNRFKQCDTPKFTNSNLFVTHIYSLQDCYYHRIIMRIIQGTYSPLVSKLKIKENEKMDKGKMKSVLHDKKVILPPYIESIYNYESYKFEK